MCQFRTGSVRKIEKERQQFRLLYQFIYNKKLCVALVSANDGEANQEAAILCWQFINYGFGGESLG